jgi:hypothetical protein
VTGYLSADLAALVHIVTVNDVIATINLYAVDGGVTWGAFPTHPDTATTLQVQRHDERT